jgi:hypothetical protein
MRLTESKTLLPDTLLGVQNYSTKDNTPQVIACNNSFQMHNGISQESGVHSYPLSGALPLYFFEILQIKANSVIGDCRASKGVQTPRKF